MPQQLTPREQEVLIHINNGLTNRQIAERLTISMSTVKWYIRQIYRKLALENREEAVERANQLGLSGTPEAGIELPAHNLPAHLTPFVGRQAELSQLRRLLLDPGCRLLTIAGPGGMGKTRLALEIASLLALDLNVPFADGVFLVLLADLNDADSVVSAVADAVGLRFYQAESAPEQQLEQFLRQKNMLLLLDNFEHLIDDKETLCFLTDLLTTAIGVTALITSRVRLNIRGEQRFPLHGLDVPSSGEAEITNADSIHLFTDAAQRANPTLKLNSTDLASVVAICRLLEGMPLAIELAAVWMEMLSPQEIAAEIARSLNFLETDLQDVPSRHQSIRAVFDSSWKGLSEHEQQVFSPLSIFRGGFSRLAAQEVAGASVRELIVLVNKSLLSRDEYGRFSIHELLRQFAAERLSQSSAEYEMVRDRHSAYYCAALRERESEWKRGKEVAAFAAIELDFENVRTAWKWAAERGRFDWLDQALESMGEAYSWQARYQEGEAAFAEANRKLQARTAPASAATGENLCIQAKILIRQAEFNREFLGQHERAKQLLQQGQDLLQRAALVGQDTRREEAWLLIQLSRIARGEGDQEKDANLKAQSLRFFLELGDREGIAYITGGNAWGNFRAGNFDEAQQGFQQSLAIWQALGNTMWTTNALGGLGLMALTQGRLEESERLLRESLALDLKRGRVEKIINPNRLLGITLYYRGKFDEALTVLDEGLDYYNGIGRVESVIRMEVVQVWVRKCLGQYKQAYILAEKVYSYWEEMNREYGMAVALSSLGQLSLAMGEYGEAQRLLAEHTAIFRQFKRKDMLSYGRAPLGLAQLELGQFDEGRQSITDSLQTALQLHSFTVLISTLPLAAYVLAHDGRISQAVELYALVSRYPFVANSCWYADVVGKQIETIAASLPPEEITAAQERGRDLDVWATAESLLHELNGR